MYRILVIDNSEVIRELLTEYLSDLGYQVETAVNGQVGIDMALANHYDVIFCDTHMPKKNGLEVFSAVSKEKPNLPFIMTDSLPDNLSDKAINKGAASCLTKPFNLEQLKKTLEWVLAKVDVK